VHLTDVLTEDFDIPSIVSISNTKNGSGNTYLVSTDAEQYIAKVNERVDFLRIYEKSYRALVCNGLRMSAIIKTKSNGLCTRDGVSLYEYLAGESHRVLDAPQTASAMRYVNKFNEVLRGGSFSPDEIETQNAWDIAKSVKFLSKSFLNDYLPQFTGGGKAELTEAIAVLSENDDMLKARPCQLIHADLGADNFIFNGNDAVSIIDFTPEYANEWYSVCQFLYWNLFWQKENAAWAEIEPYLRVYSADYEKDMISLCLIKAAVYRLAAPITDAINNGTANRLKMGKRVDILKNMLALRAELN